MIDLRLEPDPLEVGHELQSEAGAICNSKPLRLPETPRVCRSFWASKAFSEEWFPPPKAPSFLSFFSIRCI